MQLWDDFWKWANDSQLGAAVVGGLIVLVIAGLVGVIPKLRVPVFAAIRRAWAFIISIRVTTTTQIEAGKEVVRQEGVNPFAHLLAVSPDGSEDTRTLRQLLVGTSPAPQKFDFTKQTGGIDALLPDPFAADAVAPPPPEPEPVTWSARRRGDGSIVLTNLSKTDSAFHVDISALGLFPDPWDLAVPAWEEVAPKQTLSFGATRDPKWPTAHLTVVWEDAEGRAHESRVTVLGA